MIYKAKLPKLNFFYFGITHLIIHDLDKAHFWSSSKNPLSRAHRFV